MSTTKAVILTSVILATVLFVVFGIREVKKNNKKSFDSGPDSGRVANDEVKTEYSLQDIVKEIK